MLAVAIVVIAAGVVCTLTRSVWMGTAVAGLAPLTIYLGRSQKIGVVVLGTLVVGMLLAAKGANLTEFKRDKHVSAHDMAKSASLRPLLATITWRITRDQPIFGCGFQRYQEVSQEYINSKFSDLTMEQARGYVQHNVFLALLVETGIVGVGLNVALLGVWCWRAWRLANNWQADEWTRKLGILFLAFLPPPSSSMGCFTTWGSSSWSTTP